jgi:hypothetical protein
MRAASLSMTAMWSTAMCPPCVGSYYTEGVSWELTPLDIEACAMIRRAAPAKPPRPSVARMTGARAAAGVLFLDEDNRILMVVPSYKDTLEIP